MKNIYDYKHIKSVSAYALTDKDGKIAGKILANWSDNPAGSVCTAQVILFNSDNYDCLKIKTKKSNCGEYDFNQVLIGKAGGYGYDKISSAIASAIRNNCTECPKITFDGVGIDGGVDKWFKEHLDLDLISIV